MVELIEQHTMFGMDDARHTSFAANRGRRLARRENGRVCQRVLMIANMLEGMEHEAAARLAGLSRSAATNGITAMKRMVSRDCVTGRGRGDSHG